MNEDLYKGAVSVSLFKLLQCMERLHAYKAYANGGKAEEGVIQCFGPTFLSSLTICVP